MFMPRAPHNWFFFFIQITGPKHTVPTSFQFEVDLSQTVDTDPNIF